MITPLERAIAAVNNTARVQDISGDQMGVLGDAPLHVVTNPDDVVRAVLAAIREPSEVATEAGFRAASERGANIGLTDMDVSYRVMIDAMLEEG